MATPITISKKEPAESSMYYAFLRNEGLKHIEKIANVLWTDYNIHDPGITLLETLSYAVTDLGYRTNHPMKDLLATATDKEENFRNQFFTAARILPVKPVSETDYRKLFIDIDGVKNAWLYKAEELVYKDCKNEIIVGRKPAHKQFSPVTLNGLYHIKVELDELTPEQEAWSTAKKKQRVQGILEEVKQAYHCNRNLCEDLHSISVVDEHKIIICSRIEIKADADAKQVYASILEAVTEYLSPSVPQYTLTEMLSLAKEDGTKYRMDEIFEGPLLAHGFITDEAIKKSALVTSVYTSDLISLIMDIPGVVSVKEILLNNCDSPEEERHEWCLAIPEGKKPALCFDKLAFSFYKDVVPVNNHKQEALDLFRERQRQKREKQLSKTCEDFKPELGNYPGTSEYTSVTHHLPQVYGISNYGLPDNASELRKAQARQLKSYLLFFDQLLANYLSQLQNIQTLFRVVNPTLFTDKPQTYFFQKVTGIKDIENLVLNYNNFETADDGLKKIVAETDNAVERKNRFLDHLVSRFAENFNTYVLQLYSVEGNKAASQLVIDKSVFLQEYPEISAGRASGYTYTGTQCGGNPVTVWDTFNVTGLEHRVARLLGMDNYQRRVLSHIKTEVYEELDADTKKEYRFRLIDAASGKILLSSSTKYTDKNLCETEFISAMQHGMHAEYYSRHTTSNGKFYFNVVNEEGLVIARRIEYFDSEEQMETAINFLIQFVRQKYNDEGLFVVEHILLRPDPAFMRQKNEDSNGVNYLPTCADDDCKDGCGDDPYSFRITVVLPAESLRMSNMDFREYIDKTIRMETPAHIYPKICWVNKADLQLFEQAYKPWLVAKLENKLNTDAGILLTRELIKTMYLIKSIYPEGKLTDCENTEDNPMILGRTSLGNK